jgi:hypothetical protein
MHRNGLGAMEPTIEAENGWMEMVYAMAQRTLLSKAQTWYVGANIEGKPKGLTLFTGGFPKYTEYCAASARAGYRDFTFKRVPRREVA